MFIDFYINFFKRKNSTLQPVEGGIIAKHRVEGYLKAPCSILEPVVEIEYNLLEIPNSPAILTYAYIPDFFRYYFVKDWVTANNRWIVTLEVDTLASWKNHIGDTRAYIERASGLPEGASETDHFFNPLIPDTAYPGTDDYVISDVVIPCSWIEYGDEDYGCYVIGIVEPIPSNSAGGAVTYYALNYTEMKALVSDLLSTSFYANAGFPSSMGADQQISQSLAKAIINPLQYITSAFWFPCEKTKFTLSSSVSIKIGPWQSTATGSYILNRVGYRETFRVTPPTHPQAATRGSYLQYAPFTQLECFLAPFGSFPIDTAYLPVGGQIEFNVQVDGITGKACLQVGVYNSSGAKHLFYETAAMFGVPIQLNQTSIDYIKQGTQALGAVGAGIGAVAQGAMGNFVGAAHSALLALGSVGNTLISQYPQTVSQGANGSFISFDRLFGSFPRLTAKFTQLADETLSEIGRPLCEVRKINTLSGFIKCGEVSIDYNLFSDELDTIENYLKSGFFWE